MTERVRAALLVACIALAVAHVVVFGDWVVEDAAISWAFARNIADGLGAVPFAGSEPVEGYSNPTWVALLVVGELVGVPALWTGKFLAASLNGLTVFLVYRLASSVLPDSPWAPHTAALLYAANSQVGFFGAAGLENPLFNALLAGGVLFLVLEHREPRRRPWSAVLFGSLVLTRPEGVAYVLAARVLFFGAQGVGAERWRAEWRWWAWLLTPLLVYHVARWSYFGWALPATAYSKLPADPLHMLRWHSRGWVYVREYFAESGQGWFLPAYVVGITGVRGRLARVGAGVVAVGAALYLAPDSTPIGYARCIFPFVASVGLGALAWVDERPKALGTLWAMAVFATFFAVYVQGDWMEGARWMTMAAVPGAVLLAAAMSELASLLESDDALPLRRWTFIAALAAFVPMQLRSTAALQSTEDLTPFGVRQCCVWKVETASARLHVDEPIRVMTAYMGGFLWFFEGETIDRVGLVDMPIAQHRGEPWFARMLVDYTVQEKQPHFLFLDEILVVLDDFPEFAELYPRGIFGYRVRRDLLFSDAWTGPQGRAVTLDGTQFVGWDVPANGVAAGSELYLELGLATHDQRDPLLTAFLVDEQDRVVAEWLVPFDGPSAMDWPRDGVYHGRHTLDLPEAVQAGSYRIGFALRSRDGVNAPVVGAQIADGIRLDAATGLLDDPTGTWLYPDTIDVVSAGRALELADQERTRAIELADEGECERARRLWFVARKHGVGSGFEEHAAEQNRAQAACRLAQAEADPERAVEHLEAARRLDPATPGLHRALQAKADELERMARRIRKKQPQKAFRALVDSLRLDPYRTRNRTLAEELRRRRYERLDAARAGARHGP